MILQLILDIVFNVLNFMLTLLPVFDLPAFLSGGVTSFLTIVKTLAFFFPIGTLFLCIASILAIDMFYFGVWVVNWVVHRVPIVG